MKLTQKKGTQTFLKMGIEGRKIQYTLAMEQQSLIYAELTYIRVEGKQAALSVSRHLYHYW